MKKFFCFALAIMMLFAFAACSNSSDGPAANGDNEVFADGDQYDEIGGELNILNWGEYIDPELITLFEEETGVKVNYVEMTSNEEMLIKLKSSDCVYHSVPNFSKFVLFFFSCISSSCDGFSTPYFSTKVFIFLFLHSSVC